MSNLKSAILFSHLGDTPTLFDNFKIYDFGTGYVALENDEQCLFTRILDEREITLENKANTVVLKTDTTIKEISVIIINSRLKSIKEADNLVKQF